jgi:hypothetical protein
MVRRVIIFLNISRHPLLICLHCCLHQYKTLKAVSDSSQEFKQGFWGFIVVSPLFNHLLHCKACLGEMEQCNYNMSLLALLWSFRNLGVKM